MSKCCILGHRKVELTNKQIEKLKSLLESLIIEHQVDEFLFGTKSDFIYLCHDLVTKFKKQISTYQ